MTPLTPMLLGLLLGVAVGWTRHQRAKTYLLAAGAGLFLFGYATALMGIEDLGVLL